VRAVVGSFVSHHDLTVFELEGGKQRKEFVRFEQSRPLVFDHAPPKTRRLALQPWTERQQFVGCPNLDRLATLFQFITGARAAKYVGRFTRCLELDLWCQRHLHQGEGR